MGKRAATIRNTKPTITQLGRRVTKFEGLETFPRPKGSVKVDLISSEITSNCPVTGAPDFYTVKISYFPDKVCVESKTCKMLFQSYRNKGIFCEAFASELAQIFANALQVGVMCEVIQTPRGGIGITALSKATPEGMPNTHYGPKR